MKIIECCPFFKENLIAEIHIKESAKWVDEIHITECDMTHQYREKAFYFEHENLEKVRYHKLSAKKLFLKPRKFIPHIKLTKKPAWHPGVFKNGSWYNEGMQRLKFVPDFKDDDILVLSDIDEIIDAKFAPDILAEVEKRGIVTVKFHFTLFYFNLFSKKWGGPADYSYRTFIVKGKVFREQWNSDYSTLRRSGERFELMDKVYCMPDIVGFHHSWLGDEKFISEKLAAYTHVEHAKYNDPEYIKNSLAQGVSIFPDQELEINNTIQLLDQIEQNRERYKALFIVPKPKDQNL